MAEEDKSIGAFLGLAIGDAMGAPVEFMQPGTFKPIKGYRSGGPFNLKAGYWTDDTSMAMCLADSLIYKRGEMDLGNQMRRYTNWYKYGHNSSTGECFDIGDGTLRAIENFLVYGLRLGPSNSEGNGSLMRLAPVSIACLRRTEQEVREACELSSMVTHNHYASQLAGEFGVLIHRALNGGSKEDLHTSVVNYSDETAINNSGHAPKSLASALFNFHSTDSFEEAILQAVNLGDDSDTVGAITGQLAGAYYGFDLIPSSWVTQLHSSRNLCTLAQNLYNLNKC